MRAEEASPKAVGGSDGTGGLAIVGSGVVGTATGAGFQAKGYRVVLCDTSLDRVALLRRQGFWSIDGASLANLHPDAYFISVPTPTVEGRVDLSFVEAAAQAVGRAMIDHPGHPLVVVRSTVPPGTTEDLVGPAVGFASGREPGRGFGLCMNPEFLRAATAHDDFLHPRIIVIGALDEGSERALTEIYSPWADVPLVSLSLRTAEAMKYVANLFNATKISFFNEMHRILLVSGCDPDAAFAAATRGAEGLWNPSYGARGGAAYGGICLPKDTRGFLGFARDLGMEELMPLLRATIRVNEEMEAFQSSDGRFRAMREGASSDANGGRSQPNDEELDRDDAVRGA